MTSESKDAQNMDETYEQFQKRRAAQIIRKLRAYQNSATNMEMITRLTGLDEETFLELTHEFRELAGVDLDFPPQGIVMYTMMMFAAGAILSREASGAKHEHRE